MRCSRPFITFTAGLGLALGGGMSAAHADPGGTIALSWNDEHGSALESFVGTPVTVPGDAVSRTLTVRNDGPTSGTLRATIVNVELLDPGASDVHHNPGHRSPGENDGGAGDQGSFYDDLTLHWDTVEGVGSDSFSALLADQGVVIAEHSLARGESTEISIGYEFPAAASSGNRANVAPRQASFDVLLEIGGDLPDPTPTTPEPAPAATPPAGGTAPPTASTLPVTGAAVGWLIAGAAVFAGVGAGVVRDRRRA